MEAALLDRPPVAAALSIRRERDTALISRVGEEVRSSICYHDDAIDWAPAIDGCVVLSNGEDAVSIFEESQGVSRVFQSHIIFSATCRGRRAIEAAKAMVAWMFEHGGADAVWGAIPMRNERARWFARQIGAESIGHDTYEAEGPVELFIIRRGE